MNQSGSKTRNIRTIKDIVAAIQRHNKLTLLLGAGISVKAGIPTANGIIVKAAQEFLGAKNIKQSNIISWLKKQTYFNESDPYASVLDAALPSQHARAMYFEQIIANTQPTQAHLIIAELINKGYLSAIATTNFDRLMEYAILKICKHMPSILLVDELPEYTNLNSKRSKIFKLHGDYLYGNIKNLEHELFKTKMSMSEKLKIVSNQGVMIVVGYSGGDTSVMESLNSLAKDENAFPGGVFWLNLKDNLPRPEVIDFIRTVKSNDSGIVEVEGCDEFFAQLLNELPNTKFVNLPKLSGDAHISPLIEDDIEKFVLTRLDPLNTEEFMVQFKRSTEIKHFCQTYSELDFLLASYEERCEISRNIGHLIDRYIDILYGGILGSCTIKYENEYEKRLKELKLLKLAKNDGETISVNEPSLKDYLNALKLKSTGFDLDSINKMLGSDENYRTLRMYIGLIKDGSRIVKSAINITAGIPGQYGFNQPWPEIFYRAAALPGASNYVDKNLIERIIDILAVEFDIEHYSSTGAIHAIASIGALAIDQMIEYLLDPLQDTVSQDAALVLGEIGTRKVVESLDKVSIGIEPNQAIMIIFALGQTQNPRAINVIKKLAPNIPTQSQSVIDDALQRLKYDGIRIEARSKKENVPYRNVINKEQILEEYCPEVKNDKNYLVYFDIYKKEPYEFIKFIENIKWGMDFRWPKDMTRMIIVAQYLRNQGKLSEAEIITTECLRRYPMINHIYHDLALIYSYQKRHIAARRYYSLALSLQPNYVDFYNDFAATMIEIGNLEAARFLLVTAIKIDMNNYRPWFNLSSVNMGNLNKNILKRKDIRLNDGGIISTFELANLEKEYLEKLNIEEANWYDARICLQQVLVLNPKHPTADKILKGICNIIGDPINVKPTPHELFTVLHLGETELGVGADSENWPESAFNLSLKAQQLRYTGDFEGALDAIKKAYQIYPDSADIILNLSLIHNQLGNLAEAIHVIEDALLKFPWHRQLLLNYSGFLKKVKRYDEAIIAAKRAIQVNASAPACWITLSKAYLASGKLSQARDTMKEAIRLSPSWSWELLNSIDLIKKLEIKDIYIW